MPSKNSPQIPNAAPTAMAVALSKASKTPPVAPKIYEAGDIRRILLGAFDALRDLPANRELTPEFAAEKYAAIYDAPRELIESLFPLKGKDSDNEKCQIVWDKIIPILKEFGLSPAPAIGADIADSYGIFIHVLVSMGFSKKEDLTFVLWGALRKRKEEPKKIFDAVRSINGYAPWESALKILWRDEFRKLVELAERRGAFVTWVQKSTESLTTNEAPLVRAVTRIQVELTRMPNAVFAHITHPFFEKFNWLITLQGELWRINADIAFMWNQLLGQTTFQPLPQETRRKKPSRNNHLSSLETLSNLAHRRDKLEARLAEYHGYTRDEILREWKKRFTDTKDFGREFHLNEIGRLMRSIADVRDVREVLEKDILTPLVQKNKLYRRAADILMRVSESQDTQKTLREELDELVQQANKATSIKSVDDLERRARDIIEMLQKEMASSQGLTNQINSINMPLIVDGVSKEINAIS